RENRRVIGDLRLRDDSDEDVDTSGGIGRPVIGLTTTGNRDGRAGVVAAKTRGCNHAADGNRSVILRHGARWGEASEANEDREQGGDAQNDKRLIQRLRQPPTSKQQATTHVAPTPPLV